MTLIVAEVGSNFRTLHDCLHSISMAKMVGADAVKFQLFTSEALYGVHGKIDRNYCLPIEWLPLLKEKADACGIEFMCTAFSPEFVEIVDQYVDRHKVASSDINYYPLLSAVAKTKKPVLFSTGGANLNDIRKAMNVLYNDCESTTVLYCVGSYPARTIDLGVIKTLGQHIQAFHVAGLDTSALPLRASVGFSDHSTDIYGHPVMAVRDYGATVLEKHFTAHAELDTPDRPHSLTVTEFKQMTDRIKQAKLEVVPTFEEKAMALRHRRRLIATKPIKAGDEFRYGVNYGLFRATKDDANGLCPEMAARIRFAACDIAPGEPIGPDMVK